MCFLSFISSGDDKQLEHEMKGKNMKRSKHLGRNQRNRDEKKFNFTLKSSFNHPMDVGERKCLDDKSGLFATD